MASNQALVISAVLCKMIEASPGATLDNNIGVTAPITERGADKSLTTFN